MLKLNPLFSDHALLQRDKPIRVFGAGAGHIEIALLGKTYALDSTGPNWCVALDAAPAGGPHIMAVALDGAKRTLTDIFLGDVSLMSGQSNMHFKVQDARIPPETYASDASLRAFIVDRPMHEEVLPSPPKMPPNGPPSATLSA